MAWSATGKEGGGGGGGISRRMPHQLQQKSLPSPTPPLVIDVVIGVIGVSGTHPHPHPHPARRCTPSQSQKQRPNGIVVAPGIVETESMIQQSRPIVRKDLVRARHLVEPPAVGGHLLVGMALPAPPPPSPLYLDRRRVRSNAQCVVQVGVVGGPGVVPAE